MTRETATRATSERWDRSTSIDSGGQGDVDRWVFFGSCDQFPTSSIIPGPPDLVEQKQSRLPNRALAAQIADDDQIDSVARGGMAGGDLDQSIMQMMSSTIHHVKTGVQNVTAEP